jgi:hypothetical protein
VFLPVTLSKAEHGGLPKRELFYLRFSSSRFYNTEEQEFYLDYRSTGNIYLHLLVNKHTSKTENKKRLPTFEAAPIND